MLFSVKFTKFLRIPLVAVSVYWQQNNRFWNSDASMPCHTMSYNVVSTLKQRRRVYSPSSKAVHRIDLRNILKTWPCCMGFFRKDLMFKSNKEL